MLPPTGESCTLVEWTIEHDRSADGKQHVGFMAFHHVERVDQMGNILNHDQVAVMTIDRLGGVFTRDDDVPDTPIVKVALPGPGLIDEDMVELKALESLPDLKRLVLHFNPITDAALSVLRSFSPALQELDLEGTDVTDEGLTALREFRCLRAVNLDRTRLTGVGLGQLCACVQLEELALRDTLLGDAGLEELSGIRSLRKLALNGTRITDGGLVNLKKLTNLRQLLLNKTAITDVGVPTLRELKGLQTLYLDGCKLTGQGVAELRRSIPTCDTSFFSDLARHSPKVSSALRVNANAAKLPSGGPLTS